jgi:hypothetical protein
MSNIINTGDTLDEGRQKINNIYNNLSLWTAGTGSYSIVPNNGTNNESIGDYSVVGGESSLSNGHYSFIYGQNLTGNVGSFLFGKNNESSGDYNFICGEENSATDYYITIYGSGNTVNASNVFCIGQNNTINSNATSSFIQGFNSTSMDEGANIFGGYENINEANYSSIFCSPQSSLGTSASYSVILGGQSINGTFPNTVYVPYLNIETINGNSSSSNVLTYNESTKNVEKTNLPGSGFDSYRNWEQINGSNGGFTRVLETNKSYIVNGSSVRYTLELPDNAGIGDSIRVLSFMSVSATHQVVIQVYSGSSDLIVLGGGYDAYNYTLSSNQDSGLVTSYIYDNGKKFTLYKYETIEFTCINNNSGNLKWIISDITTLQNFQKIDNLSNYVSLLNDRFS